MVALACDLDLFATRFLTGWATVLIVAVHRAAARNVRALIRVIRCHLCSPFQSDVRCLPDHRLVLVLNRGSFYRRETREIAISRAARAGCVVPFVLGVSQHLAFGRSETRIVTSFLAVLASRQIALVF